MTKEEKVQEVAKGVIEKLNQIIEEELERLFEGEGCSAISSTNC